MKADFESIFQTENISTPFHSLTHSLSHCQFHEINQFEWITSVLLRFLMLCDNSIAILKWMMIPSRYAYNWHTWAHQMLTHRTTINENPVKVFISLNAPSFYNKVLWIVKAWKSILYSSQNLLVNVYVCDRKLNISVLDMRTFFCIKPMEHFADCDA